MCQHHFVLLAREHDYHLMENFMGVYSALLRALILNHLYASGVTDDELREQLISLWNVRDDRYSDERTEQTVKNRQRKKINMNYIGG